MSYPPFNIFSNREWAIIIYVTLAVIYVLKTDITIFCKFLKSLCEKKVLLILCVTILYILVMVLILSKIEVYGVALWNQSLLKDTIMWIVFTGVATLFNLPDENNGKNFSSMLMDNFKAVILFQFIFNLYSFPLWIELIIIFILLRTSLIKLAIQHKVNGDCSYDLMNTFVSVINICIGVIIFAFSAYNIIGDFSNIDIVGNVLAFILPLLLITLTIPYYYIISLFMQYEIFITSIIHLKRYEDNNTARNLILATIIYANLNIYKLYKVRKHFRYYNATKGKPYEFIRSVVKTKKYALGSNAKLVIFNDVNEVIRRLSALGIVKFNEYIDRSNYYNSSSNTHYLYIDEREAMTTIHYSVCGEENSLHSVTLDLSTSTDQHREQSMATYKSILIETFEALDILVPKGLLISFDNRKNYDFDNDTYSISYIYFEYEKIMNCKLTINSKLFHEI